MYICADVPHVPAGLLPAEGPVEEHLPQQHRDGVPGPQILAEDIPQLHCGKRARQLAAEEWHHLHQVRVLLDIFGDMGIRLHEEID